MIRETVTDAEREGSDEAPDLKLLNVLMKCIEEVIEDDDDYYDEDDDDEWDYDNLDRVCLCDFTDFNGGTCCCNYLGLSCNGKCQPDGYDKWLDSREPTYRQTFGYQVQVLSTIEKWLKGYIMHLSTLEEILQYIPYAAILSSSQKSNRFWLLCKILKICVYFLLPSPSHGVLSFLGFKNLFAIYSSV